MDLQDYRKQIDEIDRQLTALFQQRMDVAAAIADYKQAHDLPVLDAGREQEKRRAICAMVREDLQDDADKLYSTIFELSRSYQNRRMGR